MVQCAHCDIVLAGRPYVVTGGKAYCCERCHRAATRLEQARAERERAHGQTIEALVRALDAREGETANHSQRVARYTHLLGHLLGIPAEDCLHICRGALLHDIGKIGIPDAILGKPGKLTPEEWQVMQRHPEIGARILEGIPFLAPAAEIVAAHHEHYDGGGYPRGLAGEAIPIGARLFAVADALDALTTDRPYHRAEPFEAALRYLVQEAGHRFDPHIVRTLERHRTAMERLMTHLANETCVSLDPVAIETDVRRATGGAAVATRA